MVSRVTPCYLQHPNRIVFKESFERKKNCKSTTTEKEIAEQNPSLKQVMEGFSQHCFGRCTL